MFCERPGCYGRVYEDQIIYIKTDEKTGNTKKRVVPIRVCPVCSWYKETGPEREVKE